MQISINIIKQFLNLKKPLPEAQELAELITIRTAEVEGYIDEKENFKNCPQDCPSGIGDNYCDFIQEGVCDPDCKVYQDADCSALPYLVGGIVLLVLAVIGIILIAKIKKKV